MSYILEALKKAEKQRELGQVPGIDSVHDVTAPGVDRRWPWVLAVVLVLNAAIVVAFLWPADEPADRVLNTDTTPPNPVARQPENRPPAVPEPVPTTARTIDDAPSRPQPSEQTIARQRPLKALPLPVEPPHGPQPASADERAAAVPTPAPRQPAPVPDPKRLPVWPLIPDHLLDQVNGKLRLDVHVFSKNPGGRFVMLNMKKYGEGERIWEGPYLEEITQEGVILSVGGERFRLTGR